METENVSPTQFFLFVLFWGFFKLLLHLKDVVILLILAVFIDHQSHAKESLQYKQ